MKLVHNVKGDIMTHVITEHPLRSQILAEIHARPYDAIETPRAVLQQVYLPATSIKAEDDRERFMKWCADHQCPKPKDGIRQYTVTLGDIRVRWERHTEFTTLTWGCAADEAGAFNHSAQSKLWAMSKRHSQQMMANGALLISSTRVDLMKEPRGTINLAKYDTDSICMSHVQDGGASIVIDFRLDEFGSTKYTVHNKSLDAKSSGTLVRRLLEIETYRTMSLFGFENVKLIMGKIASIEDHLVSLTAQINEKSDLDGTRETLEQITNISAELANISAASQYRFSATKAYYELVQARLERIDEQAIRGYSKIEEFLHKRLAPAMRTCRSAQNRIDTAGDKLSRSTDLLRTKVEIQMQAQSHELLTTMNQRAQMQYRLQTTVEGLSIAAVSYYVVGLMSYLAKGFVDKSVIAPAKLTAIFVPIAIFLVWYIVRRIRAKHH